MSPQILLVLPKRMLLNDDHPFEVMQQRKKFTRLRILKLSNNLHHLRGTLFDYHFKSCPSKLDKEPHFCTGHDFF